MRTLWLRRFVLTWLMAAWILLFCASHVTAYVFGPNDFAVQVVEYTTNGTEVEGYTNAASALGRPTVDTDYKGEIAPAVPVLSPWRDNEVVSIGYGPDGTSEAVHLTLKFGRAVEDDVNNPYGLDFIVFGNTWFMLTGGQEWTNDDPGEVSIPSAILTSEAGRVSVAQSASGPWYTYGGGALRR